MGVNQALTWDDDKKRGIFGVAGLAIAALLLALIGPFIPVSSLSTAPQTVVVMTTPGAEAQAEAFVMGHQGVLGEDLSIINGFSATLPERAVSELRSLPFVTSVTPDRGMRFESSTYDPSTDGYSQYNMMQLTAVTAEQQAGGTGQGVTVALIDTGVTPVSGLDASGKVINGPDLSFDSQSGNLRHKDSFGHGTFMAGIIAAKDSPWYVGDQSDYAGVAPDANILNVKVGATNGAVDVIQVIAAMAWVAQHANDNGMNVRVLNMSLGYDNGSTISSYTDDPVSFAAEQVWKKGIVVVAATGNDGTSDGHFLSPARDPHFIAVGADDTHGTWNTTDDTIPAFDQSTKYNPTLVAPGVHVQGLRVAGSYVDQTYSSGRLGSRYFRGSGTSEATAYTSGVVADLISRHPSLTPDQVKWILEQGATALPSAPLTLQGNGLINAWNSDQMASIGNLGSPQSYPWGDGDATLEAARGGNHVTLKGTALSGEKDIFTHSWCSSSMASAEAGYKAWNGGTFNGVTWSGGTWSGGTWSSANWTGVTWSGGTWSGGTWSGSGWAGATWSGGTWSGGTWSGGTWSGGTWSSDGWTTASWS